MKHSTLLSVAFVLLCTQFSYAMEKLQDSTEIMKLSLSHFSPEVLLPIIEYSMSPADSSDAESAYETWRHFQNIALTNMQFNDLATLAIPTVLANNKNPQENLFNFTCERRKIGNNTAKIIVASLVKAGANPKRN